MRRLSHACVLISVCLALAHTGSYAQTTKAAKAAPSKPAAPGAPTAFTTGPTPAWVSEVPLSDEKGSSAVYYRLVDEQVLLEADQQSRYRRTVKTANEAAGLSGIGNIHIVFDPSYETLTFHKVDILRGGNRINALDKSRVKLLQREPRLEMQMYDGRVTASLALDDVRVGDTVDLAYTVKGANPVFSGKYVDSVWMVTSEGNAHQTRFRLLAPEGRKINYRASVETEVSTRTLGKLVETSFVRKPAPQWQGDDNTPSSYYLRDQVRLSEFTDWHQISEWGRSLFEQAKTPDAPALQEVIRNIQQQNLPPEEQLVQALDFVQKDIRYFGTEVGPYSHQPAEVGKVLAQRFGDCKDKASLLVAILRGLNIQATPVLASQSMRDKVDDGFATPFAFDHAIVRAELGGKSYWLDGTRQMQRGRLDQRESFGLGKTLVLEPTATQLSSTPPTQGLDQILVEEVVDIRNWQSPVHLTSTTTYFGEIAESVRFALAQESMEKSQVWLSKEQSRAYPTLVRDQPPVVEDVPGKNAVRVVQSFNIPKYWKYQAERRSLSSEYVLWGMLAPIRFSNEVKRTRPFQFSTPGVYRQTIRVNYPEAVVGKPNKWPRHESNRQLDLDTNVGIEPNYYYFEGVLRIKDNVVDPSEWTRYTEFLYKQYNMMNGAFYVPTMSQADGTRTDTQIRDMVKSWDGFFPKDVPKTKVQSDARVKRLVLNAQINSGRLPTDLLAGLLQERAIQSDHLGLYKEGKADLERALQLTPDNAELYADAAINAFGLNDDALAEQHIRKAMALDPAKPDYHRTLARLRYFAGDYAEAKREMLIALKDSRDAATGYGLVDLSLIAKRLQENPSDTIAPFYTAQKFDWPYPLVQGMASAPRLEDAIQLAKNNGKDASDLCEAYYYAGESLLAEGKKDQAKKYFEKAIDTGVVEYIEYVMAKRRLAGL